MEEFGKYAIEHKPNADKQDIKLKYKAWIENDWKELELDGLELDGLELDGLE